MLCFILFVVVCVCLGISIKYAKVVNDFKIAKLDWGYLTNEEEIEKKHATVRCWQWICVTFVFELLFMVEMFRNI